jgi:hypothetical protein
MTDQKPPEENLAEEFRNLGKNLASTLQTAWDSSERKRLQQEISTGLNELGATLNREAQKFNESETGQRFKAEAKEFEERLHTGEVQDKVRLELVNAMRTLNTELEKLIQKWRTPPEENPTDEANPPT